MPEPAEKKARGADAEEPAPLEPTDPAALYQELWAAGGLRESNARALLRCGEGDPKFRLGYFPIRASGELPRLILEEAGFCYDYEVIGGTTFFDTVKPTLMFGRLPVLRNYDGQGGDLVQSQAIVRFLARNVGIAGTTAAEEATVDMIFCQLGDTLNNSDQFSATALRDAKEQMNVPSFKEMRRVNSHSLVERSLAALGCFEELLERSGTGFLVGSGLTFVDLALFNALFDLAEDDNVPDFATRFGFSRLGAFLQDMESRPRIKAYLTSPRRMPRIGEGYKFVPGKYAPKPNGA
jgi:glutathione S-transferase